MAIEASVIVCSHNRADLIGTTLESLIHQDVSSDLFEIIVVDNASTDGTKELVEEKFKGISNLIYLYEEQLGLSRARNLGWKKATGKYVAFIDDDAIADKSWLKRIISAFEEYREAGIVGGKISPIWSNPPAPWLINELYGALSLLDWSDESVFLKPGQWLCGTNVAYRKELLEKHGGFCTKLGRKGKKLVSNEELLLHHRIIGEGYKVYYSPDIYVQHYISEERLQKEWFFSRFYWQGRSDAIMDWERVKSRKKYYNLIRRDFKQVVSENVLKIWLSDLDIYKKVLVWRKIGYLRGAIPIFLRSFVFGHRI